MNLTYLLVQTAHAWRQTINRSLKYTGLGISSWTAVGVIANASQAMTQRELAQAMGLEDPSVVPLIDKLVTLGLVERHQPPTDRRKRYLLVTEKGMQLFQVMQQQAEDLRQQVLKDIAPDDIETTKQVLRQLLKTLNSETIIQPENE